MRPLGITILGALVLLAAIVMVLIGIAAFFVGLAFLVPGSPSSGTPLLLNGLLYFFIGVVLGVAGAGLLRLRPCNGTSPKATSRCTRRLATFRSTVLRARL